MKYKIMGRSGIEVSALCLGTMTFGNEADEATSADIFNHCRESGVNFFDTADVYNNGRSEELLGKFIRSCRNEVVVATKAYFPTGTGPNQKGASRLHLRNSVEASLRRLGTDRIDIFYLHRFDDLLPLEESLRAVEAMVQQGKILYPAVSNYAAWQAMKALGIGEKLGFSPIYCMQPMYNLIKRQAESEILPLALAENLSVFPYNPLAGGLLTGKYKSADSNGRVTSNDMYKIRYYSEENLQTAQNFSALALECGFSPAALAVAWSASHPAVTAPLIGGRSVSQIKESLSSMEIPMTEELRNRISALTPAPSLATDRNEELTEIRYENKTGIKK